MQAQVEKMKYSMTIYRCLLHTYRYRTLNKLIVDYNQCIKYQNNMKQISLPPGARGAINFGNTPLVRDLDAPLIYPCTGEKPHASASNLPTSASEIFPFWARLSST